MVNDGQANIEGPRNEANTPRNTNIPEEAAFFNAGFTARTVKALLACGIDTPERLLFMTERN
jgi:hypothetical protein